MIALPPAPELDLAALVRTIPDFPKPRGVCPFVRPTIVPT
jgi:hypothetical protein